MNNSRDAFGKNKLTFIDRFGVYLSLRAIRKHFPKHHPLSVIDLGCGYHATLLSALHSRIHHGTGVDFEIHPDVKNISNLHFIESSIEDVFSKLKKSADVIFLMSILEHVSEPLPLLQKCYELLQNDGVLFINVPTWRGKFFLEFSAFKLGLSPKCEMEDHKMYYDKKDLWPLLIKSGFKPSRIKLKYHKFGLNLFAVLKK